MPTFSRNCSRSTISRRISRAMWRSVSDSSSAVDPGERAADRHRRELVDRHAADEHGARLGPQPRALARRARHERHVLLDLLADEVGVGLLVAAVKVRDDALEARRVRAPAAVAVLVRDLDAVAVGAVEEQVALVVGQLRPRRVEVDPVLARRAPRPAARSSSTTSRPTARSRPRRSRATGRARRASGRSPSSSRARCSARRRRAGR